MATQLKRRRGNTAGHASFTGAQGEFTFNTDTNRIHAHDGSTVGGHPHALLSDIVINVVDSGAANAIVVNSNLGPTALVDGLLLSIDVYAANTFACTVNYNSTEAVPLVGSTGAALGAGALQAGMQVLAQYRQSLGKFFLLGGSGTNFIALSGSTTLTAAQSGSIFKTDGFTAAGTIALPPNAVGLWFSVYGNASHAVTISAPSGSIVMPDGSSAATYVMPLSTEQEIFLLADGVNWRATTSGRTIVTNAVNANEAVALGQLLGISAALSAQLGSFAGIAVFGVSTILTNAVANYAIQYYGSSGAPGTFTLPVCSTLSNGDTLTFFNGSNYTLTLVTQGSDFLHVIGNFSSVVLQPGDTLSIISRADTEWDIIGGSAALQFSAFNVSPATAATQAPQLQQVLGGLPSNGYVNVTASRALGTTYTNSLPRPKLMSVTAYNVGSPSNLYGFVNGVTVNVTQITTPGSGYAVVVSFIVPSGSTYSASVYGSSGVLTTWLEW